MLSRLLVLLVLIGFLAYGQSRACEYLLGHPDSCYVRLQDGRYIWGPGAEMQGPISGPVTPSYAYRLAGACDAGNIAACERLYRSDAPDEARMLAKARAGELVQAQKDSREAYRRAEALYHRCQETRNVTFCDEALGVRGLDIKNQDLIRSTRARIASENDRVEEDRRREERRLEQQRQDAEEARWREQQRLTDEAARQARLAEQARQDKDAQDRAKLQQAPPSPGLHIEANGAIALFGGFLFVTLLSRAFAATSKAMIGQKPSFWRQVTAESVSLVVSGSILYWFGIVDDIKLLTIPLVGGFSAALVWSMKQG